MWYRRQPSRSAFAVAPVVLSWIAANACQRRTIETNHNSLYGISQASVFVPEPMGRHIGTCTSSSFPALLCRELFATSLCPKINIQNAAQEAECEDTADNSAQRQQKSACSFLLLRNRQRRSKAKLPSRHCGTQRMLSISVVKKGIGTSLVEKEKISSNSCMATRLTPPCSCTIMAFEEPLLCQKMRPSSVSVALTWWLKRCERLRSSKETNETNDSLK